MKLLALPISALMALLLLPSPAMAAPAERTASAEEIGMLHQFSRCIVKARPNQSARILQLDYRTDSYRRSLRNLATGVRMCANREGTLRMAGVLLAGAFAEALLPRALAGQPLASRVAFDPAGPVIEARDDGEYLGLCAVRTESDRVAAVLAAAPASADEAKAIAAITPRLAACVRQGAAATLNRPALRALFALAAYRIATRPAARSGGR